MQYIDLEVAEAEAEAEAAPNSPGVVADLQVVLVENDSDGMP